MSGRAHDQPHTFLDVTEAETVADLGALKEMLAEAARDAERHGLTDVKEHLDAALDGVERADIRHES